jgi:hypothetical protein
MGTRIYTGTAQGISRELKISRLAHRRVSRTKKEARRKARTRTSAVFATAQPTVMFKLYLKA